MLYFAVNGLLMFTQATLSDEDPKLMPSTNVNTVSFISHSQTYLIVWKQHRIRHNHILPSTARKDYHFCYIIWGQWIASPFFVSKHSALWNLTHS
jgi:hypothetical protein